jgi:hypothetical protein
MHAVVKTKLQWLLAGSVVVGSALRLRLGELFRVTS